MKSPTPKASNYDDIILIPKLNAVSTKGQHLKPQRVKVRNNHRLPQLPPPSAGVQEVSNKWEASSNQNTPTPSEKPTQKSKFKKYEGCKQQ